MKYVILISCLWCCSVNYSLVFKDRSGLSFVRWVLGRAHSQPHFFSCINQPFVTHDTELARLFYYPNRPHVTLVDDKSARGMS